MTIDDPTLPYDLETEIRRALRQRADAYVVRSASVGPVEALPISAERRSPRALVAAAVAFALVIVGVVLVARVVNGDSGSDQRPGGPPTSTPIPTTEPPPVPGATQVPLALVDNPKSGPSNVAPDGKVASYRAGDGPAVTIADVIEITGNPAQELSVETWYNAGNAVNDRRSAGNASGPMRAGTSGDPAGGVLQVFHYPHYESPDDPIIFYAWTRVPKDTEYVLVETADELLWQRPLGGIAVFPVPDEPVDATLRAVGADGTVLATETVAKSYNGAQYIPGQPSTHVGSDPRYPTCRPVVGDDNVVTVFDQGTRAPVRMTIEDYCAGKVGIVPGQLPYSEKELQAAGIALAKTFTNGAFVPSYFEIEFHSNYSLVTNTPVSVEDVKRRVAAAKEQR